MNQSEIHNIFDVKRRLEILQKMMEGRVEKGVVVVEVLPPANMSNVVFVDFRTKTVKK